MRARTKNRGVNANRVRRRPVPPPPATDDVAALAGDTLAGDMGGHTETSRRLTGGDVDADWQSAYAVGDEAVGGSTSTPDQDVVDELGEAFGVPQAPNAEVVTSGEILQERDRHRWRTEREMALDEQNEER